ncbi:MAG: Uma2 family endonuclease [Gemmataceae bacterium]|nr:Uma2 family endonuclease [Gemmataceae bacterium]
MAGASNPPCFISANVTGSLYSRLRGHRCRTSSSDTRIRVRFEGEICYCYADTAVIRDPVRTRRAFHENLVVIAEVLSASTRRTDEGEKLRAYTSIPSLLVYLLIEQEEAFVVARRTETGFVREEYEGLAAIVPLPEIGAVLPLAEVYEAIDFVPEQPPEEPA